MSNPVAGSQIRAGAGQAVAHDPFDAARQATEQALERTGRSKADLAFVFCADPDVEDPGTLGHVVAETAGGAMVVGCSAVSVIEGDDELEGDPAIAVLLVDGLQARSMLIDEEDPSRAAREVAVRLGGEGVNKMLLALADPTGFHPALLPFISRHLPGVPIVGGGAAGHRTFVMAQGGASSRGAALAMVESPSMPLVAISQGCRPLGPELRITRAQGNLVLELDGRPALEVLGEVVGTTLAGDLERAADIVFVGLGNENGLGDGYVVRGIVGFEPDMGLIAVGDRVEVGQSMTFVLREGNAAREEHDRTVEGLARQLEGRRPAFGLYFDCAGRGRSLYGFPGIDIAYIRRHLGDFPLAGMFSAFELAPVRGANQLHMFCGVLAVWPEA